ncbi:alpha/beta hydrolase [Corallococcus carmarthensis]|uniref:Alpha/beta hydrolase n=1 Tax=Corallococcus carmarthensis TaxID=2316728 RepID=A0A3A8JXP9_9BACT|nr:alpha/beta fold hydrolase [Corallococcus carmarthensis]NOK20666.1 alpha/beta hydrolase [Corallococcus carmarthensis]RKG96580.1 alpha/beta hydrolase [Corallococcus carmarthensis]
MADLFNKAVERSKEGLLTLSFKPDELYRVPTDDGAAIALGRYHPRGERRFAEPVLLCHGLGANRFHMDFNEQYSLARYLARAGFETWVIELRGRGLAGACADWNFDDQAEHDVRTALRTVMSTGAQQVLWVGHSKGGLMLYAHLAKNPQAPVKAAVSLGAPFTFAVQPGLRAFVQRMEPLLKLKMIPTRRVTSIAFFGAPPGPLTRYMMLADNMDPQVVRWALANVPADVAGGVGRQFARWISTSQFTTFDGSFDYREPLAGVKIPFLLIAGSRDLLAPPLAVARAKEHLGGPVKMLVAGRGHGFAADYGHADLILGRKAPDEIFPQVEAFLASNATPL